MIVRRVRDISFVLAILSSCSFAQNPIELRGGIGLSSTSYDSDIVEAYDLSSRGWGAQGTFQPRFFQVASIQVEVGFEMWTQLCLYTACYTDKTSTASLMASVGIGLSTPTLFVRDPEVGVGFGLFLNGGHEWVDAGFSEDSCLNCPIEGLEVNGGLWLEGGLDLTAHPSVSIGFAYRVYEAASDLNSRITVRIVGRP